MSGATFDDDEGSSAGTDVGKKHERPGFECHFPNEAYCDIHSNCEWCTTGGVAGDACYTRTQASMLPKAIFKCSATPSLSKPLLECHYDNEAKCVVHPNCEWCSTSDKVRLVSCTYAPTSACGLVVCELDAVCFMRNVVNTQLVQDQTCLRSAASDLLYTCTKSVPYFRLLECLSDARRSMLPTFARQAAPVTE